MAVEAAAQRSWAEGARAAIPIVVGYLPAAVAFGVAARQAGLSVVETVLMSVLVYAGASQFALAHLIGSGAPAAAAATALLLNLRHLLYGPALAPILPRLARAHAVLAAFGLTDEVFAVASATLPHRGAQVGWLFGLEMLAYTSWVSGTWAGAAAGDAVAGLLPSVAPAMNYALPALFVALLVPLLTLQDGSHRRDVLAAAAAGAVVAAALRLVGWGGWSVLAAGVMGPAAGVAAGRWVRREHG